VDESYSAAYLPPVEQEARRARSEAPTPPPGSGWLIYAGTVLAIAGAINIVYGVSAISSSDFFERHADYITGDLETWGWVVLVVGIVQLSAGLGVWRDAHWARLLGIAAAGSSAVIQLMWLPSRPLLALAVYGLDLLVLYGLIRYGGTASGTVDMRGAQSGG
jgi:hypothetical protein